MSFVALSSSSADEQHRESSIEAAVRQADRICCATSSTSPLFPSEWVRPGAHVVLVGSYKLEMVEVDTALIRRARGRGWGAHRCGHPAGGHGGSW
ncbi:hypothetical protein EDB89DRAFT_2029959 [Lactarius sanguifluus]|nr:hypothetical protein EDB89DRAFT_2029959 [Lactarius sanguifluus]